ncbi:hypothetical protein B0T17DRAFT_611630 [Bombardia bombarda]|uniref:Uncharacterized protein n=1 Tax=Bombardia bombarda TaxID=252184 RepID=A0AA39XIQ7_9PEZI|nr:hypothetical protein B0T17DRAFT_611630 [Bombardia bombarda]
MSGGYYKYRCKYFYTYDCTEWVYVNGAACAVCLAEGREAMESEVAWAPAPGEPKPIQVPTVRDGELHWHEMEYVQNVESGGSLIYWTLRHKATQPLTTTAMTTTDTPRPVMSTSGIGTHYGY